MAKVYRANPSGFCMGVKRAVELVEKELDRGEVIFTLGPIIHNDQVLARLNKRGARTASGWEEVLPNSSCIIRAHGVEPHMEEKLEERGVRIVDGTCPKVKLSHRTIEEYSANGYFIVILGDKNHGEMKGLAGRAGNCALVSSPEEARALEIPDRCLLICQTTVKEEEFTLVREILEEKNPDLVVKNAICAATRKRQEAVRDLASQVDAVVVVGGKGSANTRRLFQTALESGKPACHVETASEIPGKFLDYESVGITAGASTPEDIIEEAIRFLERSAPAEGS